MSNPPHSLPSTPQRLPFSPSPAGSSVAAHRMNQNRRHSGSVSSTALQLHNRSGSLVSSTSRLPNPLASGDILSSQPAPPLPPSPLHQSTFAPSQMPPSLFHPPISQRASISTPPPFFRASSPNSIVSSEAHAMVPVHLAPFTREDTRETDYDGSLNFSSTDDLARQPAPKSNKHSREPLLPLPVTSSTVTPRPSISVSGPYGKGDGNANLGKMPGSFERLFKRSLGSEGRGKASPGGLSPSGADSPTNCMPRSRQASPISPSANAHMRFDLSSGEPYRIPVSPLTGYKESPEPPRDSSTSLQDVSWNPIPPPDINAPLAQTPRIDPKSGKKVRNWQLHPSRNRFFLRGRILTGGDSPWAFFASLTIMFGITGVWFGTTCVWWWLNESPAVAAVGAYMCLLTVSSMFATAFRDPGILPRDLDLDPPTASSSSHDSSRVPLPRDLKVRAGVVRVKYCPTCQTYRPPRSSHCKMCDNCVDGCDHHCQWVNNCVGRRNYTSFFAFLLSAVLTLILVICTTAIHLWLLTRGRYGLTFRQAMGTSEGVGSAVAFCMSILVVWPVTALLVYHARLLLLNITTIEQIRNTAHKTLDQGPAPPNPFSHGSWRKNLLYVLCRPPGYSWLDFSAMGLEDKREINPGLSQDGWRTTEEGRGKH